MKLLNGFVLIKVEKPKFEIGSLAVPQMAQKQINKGVIIGFCDSIENKISIGDEVWFMEYPILLRRQQLMVWIDKEHCMVPYFSLNAKKTESGYQAMGSKLLVVINKKIQKENRYKGTLKLLMPDFNNTYAFNNQFGECISVGEDVKEGVVPGDIALFNQFLELDDYTIIETLPDGDEIRVVETGTTFNYEWYGYSHDGEFISNNHYLFVEKCESEGETKVKKLESGIFLIEKPKDLYDFKPYKIKFRNNDSSYLPGDLVIANGVSNLVEGMNIRYIHTELVKEQLNSMVEKDCAVEYTGDKIEIKSVAIN